MPSPFLTLVTAPATALIDLPTIKEHCRVATGTAEDDYLTGLIAMATAEIDGRDGWLGRALITQDWQLTLDAFPCGRDPITIPLPPLQSVISITYIDANGDEQELDIEDDIIIVEDEPALIYPIDGASWPSVKDTPAAVNIVFRCGYGDSAKEGAVFVVPPQILHHVKMRVNDFYDNRQKIVIGTISSELNFADTLINSLRIRNALYANG
jgi:uncharacterized phiE125 gp8 family phage protein